MKIIRFMALMVVTALMMFPIVVLAGTQADSLGRAGNAILEAIKNVDVLSDYAPLLVSGLSVLVYGGLQAGLKRLNTKWKWTGNKLVVGLFWRVVSIFFGKSVIYYNMKISAKNDLDEKRAREEARKAAEKHLKKHGGEMVKAFEKAIKE